MVAIVENKLYEYCNSLNLPIQELSILLSFSGGIDSTVLASILIELKAKHGLKLNLIHFNHNIHIKSKETQLFCQLFAQKNNVDIFIKKFVFNMKGNFEGCAREKRYYELEHFASNLDIQIIFTAHHLDDQIETLYMKMLDQSDWISKIGIRESIGKIRRPLLYVRKDLIKNIAKERKLTWIEDPTNDDISIRRNNIRKFLLPKALKTDLNIINELLHNASSNQLRMQNIVSTLDRNKAEIIQYESNKYLSIFTENIKRFEIEDLKILLYWIAKRHFKTIIPKRSRRYWIEFSNYLMKSKTGSKFTIGSLTCLKNRDELLLIPSYEDLLSKPAKIKLNQNNKWYDSYFHIIEKRNAMNSSNKNHFAIPLSLYRKGVYMRRWESGDKLLSSTSNKNILISDLFINNKLSAIGKLMQPIVVDRVDNILWVPGIAHANLKTKLKKQKITLIQWVQ